MATSRAAGRRGLALLVLLAGLLAPAVARAIAPAAKAALLPPWLRLAAEYRVESLSLAPLALADERLLRATWTEQRLRTDLGLVWPGIGGAFVQVDLLSGVLFGDNGDFGQDPAPEFGLAVTSRWPNEATWAVGLRPGADPLDPDSYAPALRGVDVIHINRAWADVLLPIGLVRIGRQPYAYGAGIAGHEGTRLNRWGVSRTAETADRVLLGTKLDELVRVLQALADGTTATIDPSLDRGVLFAVAFDWGTQDDVQYTADDLFQLNVLLQWLVPEAGWGGAAWRDVALSTTFVYRFHPEFATDVFAFPLRVRGTVGRVGVDLQYSFVYGHSREVAEGFAALAGTDPRRQEIWGMGADARVDVQVGPAELTLEFAYASGDDDPRSSTDLVSFTFVRDFNMGLLLFEHLLAFESARSAAVGVENLAQLGADSFPLTEVATEGRFTNAIALFPQARLLLLDTPDHRLHTRLGVLFAWPAAPGGVVDPVMTTLRADGRHIADDAVNWHGGDPGGYYGTEIDLQLEWAWKEFFLWTVEAAVLFPGSSLRDADGAAQTAFLVENRFVLAF